MLGCTETITVINLRSDPETGEDLQTEAVVAGVSWHGETRAVMTTGGLVSASVYRIRIPKEAAGEYLPPARFAGEGWTLRRGDTVARGGERYTVLNVHDNLSRPANPHLYLEVS